MVAAMANMGPPRTCTDDFSEMSTIVTSRMRCHTIWCQRASILRSGRQPDVTTLSRAAPACRQADGWLLTVADSAPAGAFRVLTEW
ncbi:hypothetical protein GCM10009661_62910 [Catellatospora chokoriensis]|uniref:Uncharacterized protein n=1 Tax=Catellatospora chokoriensis TaxID=310353 RepID=A0A8J3JSR6_9ACTN|nr:hypothetical protein Cch02nite_38360 [Catellatospora chokoriensis]